MAGSNLLEHSRNRFRARQAFGQCNVWYVKLGRTKIRRILEDKCPYFAMLEFFTASRFQLGIAGQAEESLASRSLCYTHSLPLASATIQAELYMTIAHQIVVHRNSALEQSSSISSSFATWRQQLC